MQEREHFESGLSDIFLCIDDENDEILHEEEELELQTRNTTST